MIAETDDCLVKIAEYQRRMSASKSTILRKIKTRGWPGPVVEDGNFVRYSLNSIKALQARESKNTNTEQAAAPTSAAA